MELARRQPRSVGSSKGLSRCCLCSDNGTSRCVRCSCVHTGKLCSSCLPLRPDRCWNCSLPNDDLGVSWDRAAFQIRIDDADSDVSASVVNERFQQAFDASLLHSEGIGYEDSWSKLWLRLVAMKNCHYDLPSGSIGRDFVLLTLICLRKAQCNQRGC